MTVLVERPPLTLERLDVAAGEATGWRDHRAGESFLYVIEGEGALELPGGRRALARESVVWLEPGDTYRLEGGPAGLAVLAATASDEGGEA
jgi:quercetin dioxygenase-like cupin family protein